MGHGLRSVAQTKGLGEIARRGGRELASASWRFGLGREYHKHGPHDAVDHCLRRRFAEHLTIVFRLVATFLEPEHERTKHSARFIVYGQLKLGRHTRRLLR